MPLLFSDPLFLQHDTGTHPERAARLESITRLLEERDLTRQFVRGEFEPATDEQLLRVHQPEHLEYIARAIHQGRRSLDADTLLCPASEQVARAAAGAVTAAVEQVLTGEEQRALCLVRPPGHHARPNQPMGFCLYNSIAVAAAHARDAHGLSRVLIVDWDVHHGNGTQDIFEADPQVWFLSVHRSPFYPGTGAASETGTGEGAGTIFNLPLEFGVTRSSYREQFATLLQDVCTRCQPELLLISAGFDAHRADPIGSLGLETEDFGTLTDLVLDAAAQYTGGKIVSVLEGGYNLDALAESVGCHAGRLLESIPG